MRVRSAVTSVSWIPSEAITGPMKLGMVIGVAHYDPPPPDVITDLEALRAADRFRFANPLGASVEVDGGGHITDARYESVGMLGSTTLRVGGRSHKIPAVAFPDLRREPEYGDGWVRFVQTVGGRTGAPMPRKVNRPPFLQVVAPTVWTTLALTLHVDGSAEHEVVGASPFPRHWIYDAEGRLVQKSGLADFKGWSGDVSGERSPWSKHDREVIITAVESALERQLSGLVMRGGAKPKLRNMPAGELLTEQGTAGDELYLVLDGMLTVEVDGDVVAEVGPGAILGERAALEGGTRTATLRAITACKVAVASAHQIDGKALLELAEAHHREDATAAEEPRRG